MTLYCTLIESVYIFAASMLTIIDTDQEGSASEAEEGLGTIEESEEYGMYIMKLERPWRGEEAIQESKEYAIC